MREGEYRRLLLTELRARVPHASTYSDDQLIELHAGKTAPPKGHYAEALVPGLPSTPRPRQAIKQVTVPVDFYIDGPLTTINEETRRERESRRRASASFAVGGIAPNQHGPSRRLYEAEVAIESQASTIAALQTQVANLTTAVKADLERRRQNTAHNLELSKRRCVRTPHQRDVQDQAILHNYTQYETLTRCIDAIEGK